MRCKTSRKFEHVYGNRTEIILREQMEGEKYTYELEIRVAPSTSMVGTKLPEQCVIIPLHFEMMFDLVLAFVDVLRIAARR